MNANLVSILSWTRPYRTGVALLTVNVIFWFLTHQRPLCVISLAVLCYYLRYLWKHRIRPEVLVDPPDNEDWVTLSSYEFEQQYITYTKKAWSYWINLRSENHLMWTSVTCTMWIFLAKLGSQVDFVTLLFVISNAAFLLVPLLKLCPTIELSSDGVIKEEDLIPEIPKKATKSSSKKAEPDLPSASTSPVLENDPGPFPVRVPEKEPRSMAAAAATFVTSNLSSPSSVMSASAAVISSLVSHASCQLTSAEPTVSSALSPPLTQSINYPITMSGSGSGPESLTPAVAAMPDHDEVVDSDPEDEFLFDAKHFDKSSSSSSTSNSFEIINDI